MFLSHKLMSSCCYLLALVFVFEIVASLVLGIVHIGVSDEVFPLFEPDVFDTNNVGVRQESCPGL